MATAAYDWINQSLSTIRQAHWYRSVEPLGGKAGPVMTWHGQAIVNFASNDYLGLAGDSRLATAAITAIQTYGTGSTGSRLLSGHRDLHRQLEQAIAQWKGTADAIVFSSGYLANLGALCALMGSRDLILTDQYNHSSLISGAKLSGAKVQTYSHCNLEELQQQLAAERHHHRRCLIVTDSVFSMDGDLCPLPAILDLADHYDTMVMVDEAHGTGILGATGAGAVEHWGCCRRPLIQMGTLSKALGSLGGYVTGPAHLVDYLRNRAPSWIYTTGLPPGDTAAALAAVEIVQTEPQRRDRLWQNVDCLRQALPKVITAASDQTLRSLLPSNSPILCVEVANAKTVTQLGQCLKAAGFFVSAVRPPTVPTSRLRMTVMATHEPLHIKQLVTALQQTITSLTSSS